MNGQIKELTNLEDFKKVYKVFSGPPYNENLKIGFKQIPIEIRKEKWIKGG
ncbi:MAG: hypothetical protein HFJ60_02805 [Clostridia bacterium]|jgi:hypothetical protein|nr:hypothetical protein [Clostridia bacterium]